MLQITLCIILGVLIALLLLIWQLPKKVQYIETIIIKAPITKVYDAIRYQKQLMKWSAWPTETNSLCLVKNTDGQVGAQTVYTNQKGKKFGFQEVTALVENEKVSFYLKSFVAPFEEDVRVDFILKELPDTKTEVSLWFDEKLKKPFFLIAYFGGVIDWVHKMHLKDLAGLKQYAEAS
ncbi:MAG: SRPBCC domain-containing protein [Thermonemataceae bacterium]